MNETKVWLVWLRIARLPGCKALPDAFDPRMECALVADSPEDARTRLDAALSRDRWAVEHIEDCRPFRAADWDERSDPRGFVRQAASDARSSGGLVWASFARGPSRDPGSGS